MATLGHIHLSHMFSWLRWAVGTTMIVLEWEWYTRPWLRRSYIGTSIYCIACTLLTAPLLAVYLPAELFAHGRLWLRRSHYQTSVHRKALHQTKHVADADFFRVASFNVQSCTGSDVHENVERTARTIAKLRADIVALQEVEVTPWCNQPAELAAAAGFDHFEFFATRPLTGVEGHYGNAILSKHRITARRVVQFERWWGRAPRACLLVRVCAPPSRSNLPESLWFGSCHLQHDLTGLENGQQLRMLATELAGIESAHAPCVVGVDANMAARTLGSLAAECGLVEHCGWAHSGTFPASRPLCRLDGILSVDRPAPLLIEPEEALGALASWDEMTQTHASDHRPVCGRLVGFGN
jgi:endonuclease/exonuclease/phosphatase family metal-dependent hydrolase